MKKQSNLTYNEVKALQSCMTYSDMESQLEDNYSWFTPSDFEEVLLWNSHQVAGLISSLTRKGFVDSHSVSNFNIYCGSDTYDMAELYVTDAGVVALFEALTLNK